MATLNNVFDLYVHRLSDSLVEYLVEKGIDINRSGYNSRLTSLQKCIMKGNVHRLKHLLSLGADPSVIGYNRKTAFEFAVEHDKVDMINVLLAHGERYRRDSVE
jgi:ankyrin repeat protein